MLAAKRQLHADPQIMRWSFAANFQKTPRSQRQPCSLLLFSVVQLYKIHGSLTTVTLEVFQSRFTKFCSVADARFFCTLLIASDIVREPTGAGAAGSVVIYVDFMIWGQLRITHMAGQRPEIHFASNPLAHTDAASKPYRTLRP